MSLTVWVLAACALAGAGCGVVEARLKAAGLRALDQAHGRTPQEFAAARMQATLSSGLGELTMRLISSFVLVACMALGCALLVSSPYASSAEVLPIALQTAAVWGVAFVCTIWLGGLILPGRK